MFGADNDSNLNAAGLTPNTRCGLNTVQRHGRTRNHGVVLGAAIFSLFLVVPSAPAQDLQLSGQLSTWLTGKPNTVPQADFGVRYIPELSLTSNLSESVEVSAEAALDMHGFGTIRSGGDSEFDGDVDPYRLWARLALPKWEMRAGLQKINFGSATLLRPLRWFDSIDPRDPLQLTDGVYGLLGRYYFQNNANIWVWALYGNDDLKGWEFMPSDKHAIEFGGRVQMPVPVGEIGLSYHQRRVAPDTLGLGLFVPQIEDFTERRIGVDGKWDVGVGLWFESTITHRDISEPELRYEKLITVGADYTFDIGNGPHVLFEQFMRSTSEDLFDSGETHHISALAADYPLSLLDSVSATVYYDWENDNWSRFLRWQRTYDKWQVHVSAFWNPEQPSLSEDMDSSSGFGGKGVQLMFVFNH